MDGLLHVLQRCSVFLRRRSFGNVSTLLRMRKPALPLFPPPLDAESRYESWEEGQHVMAGIVPHKSSDVPLLSYVL